MNRRTYLAIACASLAGCTGSDEKSTDEPAADPTTGPTTTAPTDTATEEPTDTPEPTDDETPTPSDESIAADHLQVAEDHLQAAVAAFADSADEDGLLAVDGSVAPNESGVSAQLSVVTDELDAASTFATAEQQETIEDLRHVRTFLSDLLAVHVDIHDLWVATRNGITAAIGESLGDLGDRMDEMSAGATSVTDGLDGLAAMADPDATAATDAVSEAEYTDIRDRFAAERATAKKIRNVLEPMRTGMYDFGEGTDYYTSGSISSAEAPFWASHNSLEDAVDAMPGKPAAAYDPFVSDLDCFLSAVEVAAAKMERSAELGRERVSEDAAQDALEGCDLVSDSPSASQLLTWLQDR